MSTIRLPYGKTTLDLTLPDGYTVEVIAPQEADPAPYVLGLTRTALANPVGLAADVRAGARSAAVAINDKTRPIPYAALIALLDWLEQGGLAPEAITLLFATGTHAPMAPSEFAKVLPAEMLARYPVRSHDCDDAAQLVSLGTTPRGTPVWANRAFVEADLRVVVGNLEAHQFMGFSGGVKGAAIGLAGRATITRNHALLIDPRADAGRYDDNPTRQDVEDIGRLIGVHLALNAVLNAHKQIVQVLAGDPLAVMQQGMPLVRALVEVPVSAPFDLVIASPGGHPKDINLYQGQKALAHAARITRDGGAVIVTAACPEGTGGAGYEGWVQGMESQAAVVERFNREEFRLGPHKAFQIARDAVRLRRVVLLSEMAPERVRELLLEPARSLDEALSAVLPDLPTGARIGVMPAANATVPRLTAEP